MKCLVLVFLLVSNASLTLAQYEDSNEFNIFLTDWSDAFLQKTPQDYKDTLNFHLKDNDTYWRVVFSSGEFSIHHGKGEHAKIILTAYLKTYRRLHSGELNPLTAAGRASITEPAELDFLLESGMTLRNIDWNYAYFTLINFLNRHPHNKVKLGKVHSKIVHGGNVVGMYYSPGFRSAWYHIAKGQMLNEDGEKDPFHQSFTIISGNGYAKLGNDIFLINENEAYYIRPNLEHKIWTENEDGITLIWNAWGKEAW
jgi:mannose-6-phosphate isomerase-like protein (cupin superfamily)